MQQQNLKILVLAKQVPDTRNVGKDAMTPEGTVNRAALPAIFNPEDLNALEAALRLKDRVAGSTVHILTMGPQRAADIIRDAMFRGADGGYLLSGREFAGSDTLATSYALSCALKKIAVLCVSSILRPVLYSLSSPSMMKMLKSSPMPKMKVERMIVTMLNSTPNIAISPRMMTQLMPIGSSDISVSSIRP